MDLIEVSNNQKRHPWELSRTHCILNELKKIGIHGNILDIGCGDCYFDRRLLQEYPTITIYGIDINLKEEYHDRELHVFNSLEHLPNIKFDYILMMDVLEHIENDYLYLNLIKSQYLMEGGYLFITVPAFQRLYSLHDKELKHFRRYNHSELRMLFG